MQQHPQAEIKRQESEKNCEPRVVTDRIAIGQAAHGDHARNGDNQYLFPDAFHAQALSGGPPA